jgi:hypothetical protein
MKLIYKKGSTDVTVLIFIQDSTSTTGAGKTGLLYNSSGLVCYYARPGAAAAALALATQTVTGAHADGGFVEIDATNMPGVYRLDLSDAILATGVNSVVVMLKGATGMAPLTLEIQLIDADLLNATSLGLTNLDATVSSRSTLTAQNVWEYTTRSLTTFGTLVADIFNYAIEGSLTFIQTIRIKLSALARKSAGGGTANLTFRDGADLKDRISATVDSNGNRTSVTLDGT